MLCFVVVVVVCHCFFLLLGAFHGSQVVVQQVSFLFLSLFVVVFLIFICCLGRHPAGLFAAVCLLVLKTTCSLKPELSLLCLQGDHGDEFFIIMEGFASVTQCPAEGEATKEVKKVGIYSHAVAANAE